MRRNFLVILICLVTGLAAGCVTWSQSSLLKGDAHYAPTQTVDVLNEPPSREYEAFALIEAQGGKGVSLPQLIEEMRKRGRELGADAIMPYSETRAAQQQGIIYNPWLGGYQTYSSGSPAAVLRGYAIKYK